MARDGVRILVTSASGANGNGYGAVLASGPRVISPGRSAAARAYAAFPSFLFEHESISNPSRADSHTWLETLARIKARYEISAGLALRIEHAAALRRVQVCKRGKNGEYLAGFLPRHSRRLQAGLRAGIDTARYDFAPGGRGPAPCCSWEASGTAEHRGAGLVRQRGAAAHRGAPSPGAIGGVGFRCAAAASLRGSRTAIEIRGFVEDIRRAAGPLMRCSYVPCAAVRACASNCWKLSPAAFR